MSVEAHAKARLGPIGHSQQHWEVSKNGRKGSFVCQHNYCFDTKFQG